MDIIDPELRDMVERQRRIVRQNRRAKYIGVATAMALMVLSMSGFAMITSSRADDRDWASGYETGRRQRQTGQTYFALAVGSLAVGAFVFGRLQSKEDPYEDYD